MSYKINNKKFIFYIFGLFFLLLITHFFTYYIDNRLIISDKNPKLCIREAVIKDGGTTIYYGLGYQIIKWNVLDNKVIDGKSIFGLDMDLKYIDSHILLTGQRGQQFSLNLSKLIKLLIILNFIKR